jgi:hypothetical protein
MKVLPDTMPLSLLQHQVVVVVVVVAACRSWVVSQRVLIRRHNPPCGKQHLRLLIWWEVSRPLMIKAVASHLAM